MARRTRMLTAALCGLLTASLPAAAQLGARSAAATRAAPELNPVRRSPKLSLDAAATSAPGNWRIVVKLAPESAVAGATRAKSSPQQRIVALGGRAKLGLRGVRALSEALQVVEASAAAPGEDAEAALARLRSDPQVAYAELDGLRYPHALASDPLNSGQWYLRREAAAASSIAAEDAWDTTIGTGGVIIAVIDTGVRFDHPDLQRAAEGGRLLPGFDFINDAAVANDGDGWDADPSDPGDWVTSTELTTLNVRGCSASNSSWHGTRVSGMIGALTNNSSGVSGITWRGWILPLRALGKCGGRDSDIVAAMLWAGGIPVTGAPLNPFPARVINMSLGGGGTCSALYRDAVSQLAARGVLVVASAGNDGSIVESPASCPGVAAIAGIRHVGTKVGFSNLGPAIAVSAPGGNCVNTGAGQPCLFSLDTTTNSGIQSPGSNGYTNQLEFNVGTSFAAPIVSGIAGLMLAVNGSLDAATLIARLREGSTKPFPVSSDATVPTCRIPASAADLQTSECNCTTTTCGAGMANAAGSVAAALRPVAGLTLPPSVTGGADLTLRANAAAACGRSVASYAWSVVTTSGGASTPGLAGAATPILTVTAPTGTGSYVLRLTITDDAGRQDTADVTLTSSAATTTAPASLPPAACLATPSGIQPAFTLSPVRALVPIGTTRSFATSLGAGTVLWEVDGLTGGSAARGTISAAGLYSAPATVPANARVAIAAVTVADGTRSALAELTIVGGPVNVDVSPATATLQLSATQNFSATVSNSPDGAVTWSVNDIPGGNAQLGTVTAAGVYTAPATAPSPSTVTVSASSVADASRVGSARVTIDAPAQAPSPGATPSGGGGGGGGGGSTNGASLLALLALFALSRRAPLPRLRRADRT